MHLDPYARANNDVRTELLSCENPGDADEDGADEGNVTQAHRVGSQIRYA